MHSATDSRFVVDPSARLRVDDDAEPYPDGVARIARPAPAALVSRWPEGESSDPAGEVARLVAVRLREAMNGRSAREVGRITGVDYTTVSAILNGDTWPDLMTLARLEAGLDADLWPVGAARGRSAS